MLISLTMAVAILRMVTLGGEQEILSDRLISVRSEPSQLPPARQISCFLNGLLTVIARLLNGQSLTFGRLSPLSFNHFSDLSFSDSS